MIYLGNKLQKLQRAGYEFTLIIKDVSELSEDKLRELKQRYPNIKNVEIYDFKSPDNTVGSTYDISTYVEVRRKLEELVHGIDFNLPDKDKLAQVYTRIGKNIVYDTMAAYPNTSEEKQYAKMQKTNCRNLKNGLLQGKCVCAGYADILRNALSLVGIESLYVSGIAKEGHAWNKVKLDGEWYNVDVTWDSPHIREGQAPEYCLKSDDTIRKSEGKSNFEGPVCISDISQEEIINMFKSYMPELAKAPSVIDDIIQGFVDLGKSASGFFKNAYNKILDIVKKKDVPALNAPQLLPNEPNNDKKFENNKSWNLENYGMTKEEFNKKSQEKLNENKLDIEADQRNEENEK